MARPGRISHDTQNRLKGTVVKTYTDTIELAAEAATESDEERRARYRRERHAALMAGLEELTDLLADAGPAADMAGDHAHIEINVGLWDGTPTEQIHRLVPIARVLEVEITETPHKGSIHYYAKKKFANGLDYTAYVIAREDEIEEAQAALAVLAAERITVDYRVEHDADTIAEVCKAFARHGVDIRTDLADADHDHPVITLGGMGAFVAIDRDGEGIGVPTLGASASADAYVRAIAAYLKGDEVPCPLAPTIALRGVHRDGRIITEYVAKGCLGDHVDALQADDFAVVTLDDAAIPAGEIICGHRVELGGAR
jgi:hypothetical protein